MISDVDIIIVARLGFSTNIPMFTSLVVCSGTEQPQDRIHMASEKRLNI